MQNGTRQISPKYECFSFPLFDITTKHPSRKMSIFNEKVRNTKILQRLRSSPAPITESKTIATSMSVNGCGMSEHWDRATQMLASQPSLVSHQILRSALRHRPPVSVVRSLLTLNPAAAVASDPPSALQVAVQNYCSVAVIECLLQAWPQALSYRSSSKGSMDLLEYARRFRPKEPDLLRLLKLPIDYWTTRKEDPDDVSSDARGSGKSPPVTYPNETERVDPQPSLVEISSTSNDSDSGSSGDEDLIANGKASTRSLLGAEPLLRSVRWASPIKTVSPSSKKQAVAPEIDYEELANVKIICLAVLRGHRRLNSQLKLLMEEKGQIEARKGTEKDEESLKKLREETAGLFEQKTREQLKTQLIALDMEARHRLALAETRLKQEVDRHIRTENEQVKIFQQRLEQVEQQLFLQQHEQQLKRFAAQKRRTTASSCGTSLFFLDSIDQEPQPIVFASPPSAVIANDEDDDVRSLLTEDSFVLRRKHLSKSVTKKSLRTQLRLLLCQL